MINIWTVFLTYPYRAVTRMDHGLVIDADMAVPSNRQIPETGASLA
jgi:hypothetical protein